MKGWLRKLLLLELFRGMGLTIRVYFQRHTTVEYPRETVTFSPRFRGVPRLRRDPDTGEELCISCLQCEKICPDRCIYIDAEANPHGKGKLLKQFVIDYERCCFCGLCVDPCPTKPLKAIYMSHDYELADFNRNSFKVGKSELHDGIEIKRYAK